MVPTKKNKFKRTLLNVIGILMLVFIGIQFIRPEIKNPPVTGDIEAPPQVKAILKRSCYDCHSNETHLPWYDHVVPAYWLVAHDVKEGREGFNFSTWKDLAPADQKGKLWEAINQITAGAMPVKSYEVLHSNTKISAQDLAVLKNYLLSMVKPDVADTAKANAADKQYKQWQMGFPALDKLPKTLNGISYIPDYKNWQTVSTTERFDNGTMRVIFGNDVAVNAIKENHVDPWPNGTIFAKVAWDQLEDKDGNVSTGAFKQIEYMIKDDKKYASTKGWGFARFKTPKMIPYGKNIMFARECVSCHRPQKSTDFVFTSPIKK